MFRLCQEWSLNTERLSADNPRVFVSKLKRHLSALSVEESNTWGIISYPNSGSVIKQFNHANDTSCNIHRDHVLNRYLVTTTSETAKAKDG
jgi:hypothetical protein